MKHNLQFLMGLLFLILMFSGCSLVSLQMADLVNISLYELTTDDPNKETNTAMANLNLRAEVAQNDAIYSINLAWDHFSEPVLDGYTILYSFSSPWEEFLEHVEFPRDNTYNNFQSYPSLKQGDELYLRLFFKANELFMDEVINVKSYLSEAVKVVIE